MSSPPPYTISPLLVPHTIYYYPFCTTRCRQSSLISRVSILPIHLPPATNPPTVSALPPQPTTGLSNHHRPSPVSSPSFTLFRRPNAITHNLPATTTNSPPSPPTHSRSSTHLHLPPSTTLAIPSPLLRTHLSSFLLANRPSITIQPLVSPPANTINAPFTSSFIPSVLFNLNLQPHDQYLLGPRPVPVRSNMFAEGRLNANCTVKSKLFRFVQIFNQSIIWCGIK